MAKRTNGSDGARAAQGHARPRGSARPAFRPPLRRPFRRSRPSQARADAIERLADDRLAGLSRRPQGARHAQGGTGLRRSRLRPLGRLARRARRHRAPPRPATPPPGRTASCSSTARRAASTPAPARCPRAGGWSRSPATALDGARRRGRGPRPLARRLGVRPHDPPLQGLLLHRRAALPLALLLLPEPQPRPDRRLDERDLSDVGRGARHHDRHAGELVPGDLAAEADDGPPGLRRRRQPRPDADPRQGRRQGQGDRARRLGLSRATSPAGCSRSSCTATSRAPRTCGASIADWLRFMRLTPGRRAGRARPLHRLLGALRHQPRGARRATTRDPAGGPQRRPHPCRSPCRPPGRPARRARRRPRTRRGRRQLRRHSSPPNRPWNALTSAPVPYARSDLSRRGKSARPWSGAVRRTLPPVLRLAQEPKVHAV